MNSAQAAHKMRMIIYNLVNGVIDFDNAYEEIHKYHVHYKSIQKHFLKIIDIWYIMSTPIYNEHKDYIHAKDTMLRLIMSDPMIDEYKRISQYHEIILKDVNRYNPTLMNAELFSTLLMTFPTQSI